MEFKEVYNVCIVGFGAIGTVYGWLLDRSKKVRITAVCRSNYTSLNEHGVDIQSAMHGSEKAWKPHRVTQTVEEAADVQYDFVVGCFKTIPDLHPTPDLFGPLLSKSNTFILIQNGINIERDLQKAVPNSTVITGCAWIDCTIVDNFRRMEHGNINKLVLGVHPPIATSNDASGLSNPQIPPAQKQALEIFTELLTAGGAPPTITDNIVAARWRKNLWNSAFSTLATLARANMLEIFAAQSWAINKPVAEALMNEVIAVARGLGIGEDLLPWSATQDTINLTEGLYGEGKNGPPFKPSMLVDLESGRPMEIEGIIGEVVRQGKEANVPTPRLETAYAALRLTQRQIIDAKTRKI